MLKNLIPREGKFFELFNASAEQSVKGAKAFRAMLDDLAHAEEHSRELKQIEHTGDEITHMTVELLHKTFITPLDRDEIHQLIAKMDDILDNLEDAALRVYQYDLREAPSEAKELADICISSAECIERAVKKLHDLSFTSGILQECVEVNRLENKADSVLALAKAKLFREEQDTRQLIKLKEIFELLESVTDRCEDVANIIEGIVLEYS
jgi:predicted phosphate transport protein (TIGR00153 family)